METAEKLENQLVSETILDSFLEQGIVSKEEYEMLNKKMVKRNGLSNKSIFVKNELINTKKNASIMAKEDETNGS